MSSPARVQSIDALTRLRDALARLIHDGQTALALAESAVRAAGERLEGRLRFWQGQVVRRQEEVNQARASLSHARALNKGKTTGCAEQELELRRAEARLRHAEEKVGLAKRWLRDLPGHVKEYEGPARGLGGFLETDLRQAIALLDNKVVALEAYLSVAAPPQERYAPGGGGS